MPRKSFEVSVEPEVLVWARKSIGINHEDVAKRLNVSKDTVDMWEFGEKKPTIVQIKKLANIYKRSLAVFFLPHPPEEPSPPQDLRTLPTGKKEPLSKKTMLAIRRAQRLQSLATELAKATNRKIVSHVARATLLDDPEVVALKARKLLGIKIQIQFSWKNDNKAFNEWRKAIENLGVLVFQISMPVKEARGFSLTKDGFPAIVVSTQDPVRARIFSLFHEYGHLLLDNSGICDMNEYIQYREVAPIEKFCNHFAGAFLVPKEELLSHGLVRTWRSFVWPDKILNQLSREFKVSPEVILRRLVILNLSSKDFYKKKREEWKAKEKPKKGGRKNPPRDCIRENGNPFVALVMEAHRKEKITYSDVADYLELRVKYLPKVEQLIEGNV